MTFPQCKNTRSVHPNYQQLGRKALAYLADLRSKLASIGIPTKELDAILDGWKPS